MMKMNGNIPVYRASINEDNDGMFCVSLVDAPAVEKDFLKFKENVPVKLMVNDEDKRLVYGVVMRADFPIYRRDKDDFEYYIVYDADVIRQMAEKYLKDGYQNKVSVDHNGKELDGVDMVQFFIKDSGKGVDPKGFDDIKDGSLFAEYHVVDDDLWEDIKDGKYKGFSLEGYFGVEQIFNEVSDDDYNEILALMTQIKNRIKIHKS